MAAQLERNRNGRNRNGPTAPWADGGRDAFRARYNKRKADAEAPIGYSRPAHWKAPKAPKVSCECGRMMMMKVRLFMIAFKNYSRLGACMHTANHPESDTPRDHFE